MLNIACRMLEVLPFLILLFIMEMANYRRKFMGFILNQLSGPSLIGFKDSAWR